MKTLSPTTAAAALLLALSACADTSDEGPAPADEIPCGMRLCSAEEVDPEWGPELPSAGEGKADADDIRTAVSNATADGTLDAADVQTLFDASGNRLSDGELAVIREALDDTTYTVLDEAREAASDIALTWQLPAEEAELVLAGRTFDGGTVPAAVTAYLRQARLHGAVAYDVDETDEDGERIWSPYPATTPAVENMAFDYTVVTPQALLDDLADTDVEYNVIVGQETVQHPNGFEYQAARYERGVGGTGNVLAHYDEVYHPDIYARGRSGQKWANNVAILSDGTFHCLPAARRSYLQDLILTNPHLSRGKRMLYNGHLDIRDGVVVGIEMSGRLSKLAARDDANFIDPVGLLEAWGFEISPNLTLRYGNTAHGTPVRADGVVKSADE